MFGRKNKYTFVKLLVLENAPPGLSTFLFTELTYDDALQTMMSLSIYLLGITGERLRDKFTKKTQLIILLNE